MPVSLFPELTRRHWLKGAAAAVLAPQIAPAAERGSETWVLLSDTHIAADATAIARGHCMAENLDRCVSQITRLAQKPFGVLINGDCAFKDGQAEDYATLVKRLEPLREHRIQVHATLGNHDHRDHFRTALTNADDIRRMEQKHVEILSSALVNWILLDSLDQTDHTPGVLGNAQLGWLDRTLRQHGNRPTVVMVHHNPAPSDPKGPTPANPATTKPKNTGLTDTDELLRILAQYPNVRALLYGHTHTWRASVDEKTGIHLINLPPVGYPFSEDRPAGWVLAQIDKAGMTLELHALNPNHPEHRHTVHVDWAKA
ncbi:MAG: metallophosphoesterase [Verrucomicrobiales bacterium]|nr:metallophosphoesterase [Verrucomicrobiales bacterium]MCP5560915.1 metallophosphoesterase [Verrucomicrobiaceae bacterium]